MTLIQRYQESMLVWFTSPTTTWYANHEPIFIPFLGFFFFVGVLSSFFHRKKYFIFIQIAILTLILHFSNSALTDIVNADHRIVPLYGIGAIFSGLGVSTIGSFIQRVWLRKLFFMFLVGVCIWQAWSFFALQPANKNKLLTDYLSMNIVTELQKTNLSFSSLNITVSPLHYEKLRAPHYKEQYSYFFPGVALSVHQSSELKNTEAQIGISTSLPSEKKAERKDIPCSFYTCQPDQEPFTVFYK